MENPRKLERANEICEMVANGQTLKEIAAQFNVQPGTILNWVTYSQEAIDSYTRARTAAADLFESDVIDTARATTRETANADRVAIDAYKWVAARRNSRVYGEQSKVTHEGAIGIAEIPMTEEQRAALLSIISREI
jgi:hypothetical protein